MKKAIALLLTFALSFNLFAMSVSAAETSEKSKLTVDNATPVAGSEVKMTYALCEKANMNSFGANVTSNPALTIKNIEVVDLKDKPGTLEANVNSGVINWMPDNAHFTDNFEAQTLAVVTFEIPADAKVGTKYTIGLDDIQVYSAKFAEFFEESGATKTTTVTVAEKAPEVSFNAKDNQSGTLTINDANVNGTNVQYKIDAGEWKAVSSAQEELTNLKPCTVTLRRVNDNADLNSEEVSVSITQAQAPTDVKASGGKILLDNKHEYSKDQKSWQDCDNGQTVLDPGTYYVRVKANGAVLASEATEVKVTTLTVRAVRVELTEGAASEGYDINGNVVTVRSATVCKVGYFDKSKNAYVAISAVANKTGGYDFTAPSGVEEVVVVVKGDANGDGKVNILDRTTLGLAVIEKKNDSLSAEGQFAADVNNDGKLNILDRTRLGQHVQKVETFTWIND